MNFRFKINTEKRLCDLFLTILMLLIYFILGAIKVSPTKYSFKNRYKEIDWTIFQPGQSRALIEDKSFSSPTAKKNSFSETENIIIPSLDFLENNADSRIKLHRKKFNALIEPFSDEISNEINVANVDNLAQLSKFTLEIKNQIL